MSCRQRLKLFSTSVHIDLLFLFGQCGDTCNSKQNHSVSGKKSRGHWTSRIFKSRQSFTNVHMPYHCSFCYLACTLIHLSARWRCIETISTSILKCKWPQILYCRPTLGMWWCQSTLIVNSTYTHLRGYLSTDLETSMNYPHTCEC